MGAVDRHPARLLAAADERQVHILPVQLSSANAVINVGPVNIVAVHRQPVQTHTLAGKDNEVLGHVLPVQVGSGNRLDVTVSPIDVRTIYSQAHGTKAGGDEVLIHVLPVQVGPANRVRDGVRPVDVPTI